MKKFKSVTDIELHEKFRAYFEKYMFCLLKMKPPKTFEVLCISEKIATVNENSQRSKYPWWGLPNSP